jgi:hypothetical protein
VPVLCWLGLAGSERACDSLPTGGTGEANGAATVVQLATARERHALFLPAPRVSLCVPLCPLPLSVKRRRVLCAVLCGSPSKVSPHTRGEERKADRTRARGREQGRAVLRCPSPRCVGQSLFQRVSRGDTHTATSGRDNWRTASNTALGFLTRTARQTPSFTQPFDLHGFSAPLRRFPVRRQTRSASLST